MKKTPNAISKTSNTVDRPSSPASYVDMTYTMHASKLGAAVGRCQRLAPESGPVRAAGARRKPSSHLTTI